MYFLKKVHGILSEDNVDSEEVESGSATNGWSHQVADDDNKEETD